MVLKDTKKRVIKTLYFETTDRVPIFDIVQNIPFIKHFV